MAYVRPASSDQIEAAYDEACELYEEAEALNRRGAVVRMKEIIMHDEIWELFGFAVPLLLLAWYANRIRHPERSWLSTFLIFLGGVAVFPGAGLGLGLLWFRTGSLRKNGQVRGTL